MNVSLLYFRYIVVPPVVPVDPSSVVTPAVDHVVVMLSTLLSGPVAARDHFLASLLTTWPPTVTLRPKTKQTRSGRSSRRNPTTKIRWPTGIQSSSSNLTCWRFWHVSRSTTSSGKSSASLETERLVKWSSRRTKTPSSLFSLLLHVLLKYSEWDWLLIPNKSTGTWGSFCADFWHTCLCSWETNLKLWWLRRITRTIYHNCKWIMTLSSRGCSWLFRVRGGLEVGSFCHNWITRWCRWSSCWNWRR